VHNGRAALVSKQLDANVVHASVAAECTFATAHVTGDVSAPGWVQILRHKELVTHRTQLFETPEVRSHKESTARAGCHGVSRGTGTSHVVSTGISAGPKSNGRVRDKSYVPGDGTFWYPTELHNT
jgi:hypothetical protein